MPKHKGKKAQFASHTVYIMCLCVFLPRDQSGLLIILIEVSVFRRQREGHMDKHTRQRLFCEYILGL